MAGVALETSRAEILTDTARTARHCELPETVEHTFAQSLQASGVNHDAIRNADKNVKNDVVSSTCKSDVQEIDVAKDPAAGLKIPVVDEDAITAEAKSDTADTGLKRLPTRGLDVSTERHSEPKHAGATMTKEGVESRTKNGNGIKVATTVVLDQVPSMFQTPVSVTNARTEGSLAVSNDRADESTESVASFPDVLATSAVPRIGSAQRAIRVAEVVHSRKDAHEVAANTSTDTSTLDSLKSIDANIPSANVATKATGEWARERAGTAIAMSPHEGIGLHGEGSTSNFHANGASKHSASQTSSGIRTETAATDIEETAGLERWSARGDTGPSMLSATPTALEIGLSSSSHGWLKIRTEIESGVVTASLSAGTTAGNEMLHRELPALASYLQGEQVGLGELVVRHTTAMDSSSCGGGGNTPRGDEDGRHNGRSADSFLNDSSEDSRSSSGAWNQGEYGSLRIVPGLLPAFAGMNGSWLNVRV